MEQDIIELYKTNKNISEISKIFKLSRHKIYKILTNNNIEISKNRLTMNCPDIDKLKKLSEDFSLTNVDISKEFDISLSLLDKWFKLYNISRKEKITIETPNKDILYDYYFNRGMSFKEMESIFQCSNVTLKKYFIQYGFVPRSRNNDQKLASKKVNKTKLERYGYENFPEDIPFVKQSKGELELKKFLNSLDDNFNFQSSRELLGNKQEIDLYNEKLKLAIEYNGERYHYEGMNKIDNKYHYDKWKKCNDQDIQLIMIFEQSWLKNKEKWKNYLKSKLGIYEKRIYARKCEFKEIFDKSYRNFIDKNHLQGYPNTVFRAFGLFYNKQLVGCVTFAKHHRNNKTMTLNRLCFEEGIQVIGGSEKLLKNAFRKMNTEIITWSDNSISNGKVYEKCGMKLDENLKPDYFYYNLNTKQIKTKQSMQKKKIGCPEDMTEKDFCRQMNYVRIWDCGKKRWSWKNNS